jgi:hypothetical protein
LGRTVRVATSLVWVTHALDVLEFIVETSPMHLFEDLVFLLVATNWSTTPGAHGQGIETAGHVLLMPPVSGGRTTRGKVVMTM